MLSSLNIETESEARAVATMLQITSLMGGGGDWAEVQRNIEIANMENQLMGGSNRTEYDYNQFLPKINLKSPFPKALKAIGPPTNAETGAGLSGIFGYLAGLITTPFNLAVGFLSPATKSIGTNWARLTSRFGTLFTEFKKYVKDMNEQERFYKIVAGVGIVGLTSAGTFAFYAWLKSRRVQNDPVLRQKRDEFYSVFNEQLKGAKAKNGRKMTTPEKAVVQQLINTSRTFENADDLMKGKESVKKSPRRRKLKGGSADDELGGGDDDLDFDDYDFEGGADLEGGRKKKKNRRRMM